MLTVTLALGSALLYGLSDFIGGFLSRRTSVWSVAIVTQVAASVAVGAATVVLGGNPTVTDLSWGLFAGLGTGTGTAFLYRGLAGGRMGVVAPLSAVGAALLPVTVGVLTGERPALIVWAGIASWDGRVVIIEPDGEANHLLVIVDRYGQVYETNAVPDVSGLPPAEALEEWFRFLATACPECGVIDDPRHRDWTP